MEDFNGKMQKLQKKIEACGANISCLEKATKEAEALTKETETLGNELMKSGKLPTGRSSQTGQHEPCIGYPAESPLNIYCLPVKVTVSNKEEVNDIESYCVDGILPCNKKEYVKKYLIFSYTAETEGELVYKKDFKEFHIYAQGTAANTSIEQIQGYHNWYTLEGVDAKKKWHRENFPKASIIIRRPFKFSVFYPYSKENTTNVCFEPMEIESKNDSENWLLGTGTSKLCWNHDKIRFFVTPSIIKDALDAKKFQWTFHWQDSQPGKKSQVDNFISVKIEACKKPCEIVKKDLAEAKKMRDAFRDENLLKKAEKNSWLGDQEYNDEVMKKVFGSGAKQGMQFESPMETDPTTCKINIKWGKEDYKKKCIPEAGYNADLVHEKLHEKNCKKKANPMEYYADMSFPRKFSKEEIDAYSVKIKYLEDWIKKNCK
jgi:hypothetical protein